MPIKPEDYYGMAVMIGDQAVRDVSNNILSRIAEEEGFNFPPGWTGAFTEQTVTDFAQSDLPWGTEIIARFVLDRLNYSYEGGPARTGPPIYAPGAVGPIETPPGQITPRKPEEIPIELTLPQPSPETRLPAPTVTPGPVPVQAGVPGAPPTRERAPLVTGQPETKPPAEIPPVIPPPQGMTPDEKKALEDLVKELQTTREQLNHRIDQVIADAKKQAAAGQPVNLIDMKVLNDIISGAVDRWWKLAQFYPVTTQVVDKPGAEITSEDVQSALTVGYWNILQAAQSINPPKADYKQEGGFPFSIP